MCAEPTNAFALRRVTALVGPYGSGKTELSIGLSLWVAQQVVQGLAAGIKRAVLGDMDVLKPYFRSREVSDSIKRSGVELLAPAGALANSDLPIITPELRGSVLRQDTQMILDVGGDPVGARALGSISDVIGGTSYDLLLVLNRHRPFMDTQAKVVEQAKQIAAAAHLDFTGVISNTHLMDETTVEDVEWGLELARPVAAELGVPVRLLALSEHLVETFAARPGLPPVVGIRRRMMPHFLGGVVLAPSSSQSQSTRGATP
ncbi:MAG TPA: hypothetical protein VGK67_12390 [Myxococcales bacterium]|jgi:hypothetical protein